MMRQINKHIKALTSLYKGDAIFVYQMGKVGSSSIESSLELAGIKSFHLHTLFGATSNYNFDYGNNGFFRGIKFGLLRSLYKKALTSGNKVKIISLMRDPIGRNISTLFQELPRMLYLESLKNNREEKCANETLSHLFDLYVNEKIPIQWFSNEFKYSTGIDILKYEFDKERGYLELKEGNVEVLLLTAEKLNDNIEVFNGFVGLDTQAFISSNTSRKKWYAELYLGYLNSYQPTSQTLDDLYNNEILRYFYSKEDLKKLRSKWSK